MIVENTNDATRRIASDGVLDAFDDAGADPRAVEFDGNGRARVPAAVGEYLASTYESVEIHTDEREH